MRMPGAQLEPSSAASVVVHRQKVRIRNTGKPGLKAKFLTMRYGISNSALIPVPKAHLSRSISIKSWVSGPAMVA